MLNNIYVVNTTILLVLPILGPHQAVDLRGVHALGEPLELGAVGRPLFVVYLYSLCLCVCV